MYWCSGWTQFNYIVKNKCKKKHFMLKESPIWSDISLVPAFLWKWIALAYWTGDFVI